ncbi:MAG: hypothetical protein J0M12_02415 [Deltaproteobacteria bacterium]|nr:hypothetical protein [Deltaproteobacteria bacterium]
MRSAAVLTSFLRKAGAYCALSLVFLCLPAQAQFVRMGPLVNAGTDLHTLIVATEGEFPNTGLFVAYQDEPFEVQAVHPAQLDSAKARSFFLVFNRKTNTYSELKLQNGKTYAIRPGGSFSITLTSAAGAGESTRVSVANTANPYCSIVISRGKLPSILGYVGTQEMISIARNDKAVALLEANQMLASEEYKNVIFDFTLEKNGDLYLKGKPFEGDSIGIAVPTENPCLRDGAVWLEESTIPPALGKDETLASLIAKTPSLQRSSDDFLISNISKDFLSALDFKSGEFGVLKLKSTIGSKNYCVFSKVQGQ